MDETLTGRRTIFCAPIPKWILLVRRLFLRNTNLMSTIPLDVYWVKNTAGDYIDLLRLNRVSITFHKDAATRKQAPDGFGFTTSAPQAPAAPEPVPVPTKKPTTRRATSKKRRPPDTSA